MEAQPLHGVRIADFSQLAQGPFATQILADLGAEVIKVEPRQGEFMRHWALGNSFPGGESISFLAFNRNKRSLAVDLKTAKGRMVARRLVAHSDVLVENFRPGVMERFGLGYMDLVDECPGLVYCSSTGFGSSGPYSARPGQDLLVQALCGMPHLNGVKGDLPTPVGMGIADLVAGLHIAYSTLAALLARERTGQGQRIEVNLMSSLLALMSQEFTAFLQEGSFPDRSSVVPGSPHAGAPYGLYPTSDGGIAIAMNDADRVARLVGIAGDERFMGSNIAGSVGDEVRTALAKRLEQRSTQEWVSLFLGEDLWVAPLQSFAEVVEDPQVTHNNMVVEIDHPTAGKYRTLGSPVVFSSVDETALRPPPTVGEHSREVLEGLDFSTEEIDAFYTEEVVG